MLNYAPIYLAMYHYAQNYAGIIHQGYPGDNSEEGQGHVHKVSNCGVGQRKLTNWSIV